MPSGMASSVVFNNGDKTVFCAGVFILLQYAPVQPYMRPSLADGLAEHALHRTPTVCNL